MSRGVTACVFLGLTTTLTLGQVVFPASFLTPPQPQAALFAQPLGPQVLSHQVLGPQQPRTLAHRAVLFNDEQESLLPSHLKNPFYKNPRIAEALARESWFGPGERPVTDVRDTEKIPREKIVSVLRNAGLARR